MYEPVTLDQLRAFVTIVEEGSFSAAARKLQRVQSAISKAMANLEDQLGIALLDRSTKKAAKLSHEGTAVLAAARRVLLEMDVLKRVTAGLALGVEPSISLCVDALFPQPVLVEACAGVAPGLAKTPLATIDMIPVVGPGHPLARIDGQVSLVQLADAVQIVLSERHETGVPDRGVLSPRTWRVADLSTKHAMLRANLGWGNLPEHLARDDLRAGKLIAIRPESWSPEIGRVTLFAIHRNDKSFGPAHRWLVDRLVTLCAGDAAGAAPRSRKRRART